MPRNTRGDRQSSTPRPARYPDITTILRSVVSVDEAPEFDVLNAEVWTRDRRELVDLLETNLHGPFILQGVLRVDKDQERSFCKGAKNGPFEFEAEITHYAIDANPDPEIWIGTVCGWLRMYSSARYGPYFGHMEWSVRLVYQCQDLEEELKEARKVLKVDEFLLEYALSDGRGLQETQILRFFHDHARTMLAHMISDPEMRKRKLFLFLRNTFGDIYETVVSENKTLEANHKARLLEQSSNSQQYSSLPVRPASPIKKQSESMPLKSIPSIPKSTRRQSKSKSATPKSETPEVMELSIPGLPSHDPTTLGFGKNGEPLIHPCQVIMDMILASDPKNDRFSVKTISGALFQHWSLWWSPLSKHMLRLWSTAILDQLPARYKGTNFHRELQEVAKTCNVARRDKELAAAKKRPHAPKSRMARSVAEIHQITDDEWLAQAAEHDAIHRRKKSTNPLAAGESGSSNPVGPASKRERGGAISIAGYHDQERLDDSTTVSTPNETKEGKELQTRAEREATHAKWLESITSRSREPSPDPYSYPYQKAKYNLAHGLDANGKKPGSADKDTPASTPAPTHKTRPQVEIFMKKTPHSQKALPTHTPISQHSGKMARMKPKTVSTKRPAEDFPPILPPGHDHKRSRIDNEDEEDDEDGDEDIEMQSGPSSPPPSSPSPTDNDDTNDQDDDEIPNSDSDSPDTPINPIKPSSINMARGPNGSMRCIIPQCHFIEYIPGKKEGQDRMREHFEIHEKEDPAMRLARNEGKLNGRAVGFLMEKLREKEIGEGRVSGEGMDKDGFPLPIVRRRIFGPF
ncbi:hypothetical protein HYFRA_00008973 [Hymenoscyphus fraxineus]|uniref:Uncharacterized protein n=1 Tax=Hymenoscyphus fraxineus TaxID=746836 RepID=A0A9N9PH79_9HELO|nr:hypothetical protein HYFRA_00008973 [Hymenoscyphus fraxineus]